MFAVALHFFQIASKYQVSHDYQSIQVSFLHNLVNPDDYIFHYPNADHIQQEAARNDGQNHVVARDPMGMWCEIGC